jgi:hypothetical protein
MTGSFIDVNAPTPHGAAGPKTPSPCCSAATRRPRSPTGSSPADPRRARTDATFLHAGTRARTISGRAMPYQYWPGWKRGLLLTRVPPFLLAPWAGTGMAADVLNLDTPWWLTWEVPAGLTLPILGYGAVKGVQYAQNRQHEKAYLRPIRQATWAVLRTRDGVYVDIPRGLVHGKDQQATGRIGLPSTHALHDNDRDNLITAVRERLGHDALDVRWNMEGAHPYAELFTPPQPPALVGWDMMLAHADTVRPYLGHSAHGPVHWDLGEDSPHIGIAGGAGSGKSELMAWVVGQFMRAGAGTVVLDPKYTSHAWLARVPEVLYCREPQMIHDTVVWLDMELRRRGPRLRVPLTRGIRNRSSTGSWWCWRNATVSRR